MHPAFSVIFLTTLIGVGQGLFLALYTGQVHSLANLLPAQDSQAFYALGSFLALFFLIAGLVASIFHLGHPERAWRSMTQWRTSWLSREVIALPAFMLLVFFYGCVQYFGLTSPLFVIAGTLPVDMALIIGFLASVGAFVLFICTAMIYASLKFLREWHTPLTVANYLLLGIASGFMLAAAFSVYSGVDLVVFFGTWAVIFTLTGFITRGASLIRNRRLRHKLNLNSAIGVRHQQMAQITQGFMGGSFNTREFFHGRSPALLKLIKHSFLVMVFLLPVILIVTAYFMESASLPMFAFAVQYLGLIAERWYFFAEAKHPQNLYYQSIA
ncbi:dimethyl sulfoxide reductase anchor subunit family protein [Candidatus Vondammii sp. HM_W22]|uniref:dimethyl sulfoxide reductase anchor subunit family protein n=1 Tax=Candidatus Vondammii sp. HM_W22 TaxID=2687299 RepID=UPI001F12B79E|nr:DmsC/YnfH family molybdoenzyme membrane anchor subunit [Candidatus Vondammii sp. HM_W22]